MDDRVDQPAEAGRDVARERYRLTFDVDAAVALFESPEGIQSPQKSVIPAGREFLLVRRAGVFEFGDSR